MIQLYELNYLYQRASSLSYSIDLVINWGEELGWAWVGSVAEWIGTGIGTGRYMDLSTWGASRFWNSDCYTYSKAENLYISSVKVFPAVGIT